MTKVSLEDLVKSGSHFGHQSKRWNPKMEEYLHSIQDGIHIFDLIKTKEQLEEALSTLTTYAKEGKQILLLGTKKQAKDAVVKCAKDADILYVDERWLGGTITNFDQIKRSITKLHDMKKDKAAGAYGSYTKKERLLIDREIERLERFFGGISEMKGIPDLLIVVDIKREYSAAKEARDKGVKTIGIVDSNCDPDDVDIAVPMNDDGTQALEYVLGLFAEAIKEGKNKGSKSKGSKKETASAKATASQGKKEDAKKK